MQGARTASMANKPGDNNTASASHPISKIRRLWIIQPKKASLKSIQEGFSII